MSNLFSQDALLASLFETFGRHATSLHRRGRVNLIVSTPLQRRLRSTAAIERETHIAAAPPRDAACGLVALRPVASNDLISPTCNARPARLEQLYPRCGGRPHACRSYPVRIDGLIRVTMPSFRVVVVGRDRDGLVQAFSALGRFACRSAQAARHRSEGEHVFVRRKHGLMESARIALGQPILLARLP